MGIKLTIRNLNVEDKYKIYSYNRWGNHKNETNYILAKWGTFEESLIHDQSKKQYYFWAR